LKLAFIHFVEIADKHIAGILITEENTKPLEFRTTTDVEIDELQRILYGDALKEVLYKENFAIDLINAVKEEFDVLLTKEKEILSIRNKIDKPVVHISKFDPFKAMDKYSVKISNTVGRFDPLVLKVNRKDEDRLNEIAQKLQEIYKAYNLLEPFNRIEKAIIFLEENR